MKTFYGGTFLSKEELEKEGIYHPIKIEYYKTKQLDQNHIENYGIEIIMTEYKEQITVEEAKLENVSQDEQITNELLNKFKDGQVTPTNATEILEDFQKASDFTMNF